MAGKSRLVAEITREFKAAADPKYRESVQRFFKEPVDLHGVRTPVFREIAQATYARVRELPKSKVFALAEEFLKDGRMEEVGIAFNWAWRLRRQFEPSDFRIFERWLKKYVNNWGACDSFCCRALGEFMLLYPQFLPKVKAWTGSKNRWVRRASAVALILAVRKEKYLEEAFETADRLLQDDDDMVQKGYGWLLKEISNRRPKATFDFVMKRKATMPRTALRYAIEKLPPAWKKRAMARQQTRLSFLPVG